MHKSELKQGIKYIHPYFDFHEWVMFQGCMVIFEDGNSIDSETFWRDRKGMENNWSEFKG